MIRRIDSLHVDKRWRWTPPAAKRQGRAAETNDGGGAEPADRVRPVVHTVRRAKPVVSRLPAALRGDFGAPDLASSRDGAAEFGIRHYMFSPVTPKSPPPPPLAAPPVAVGRSPGQARLHFDDDDDDGDDDDSLPLQGRSFAPADRQSPDGGAEPAARTSPGSGRSHPSPRPLPASAIKARQLHDLTGLMDAMVRDLEVAASSSPSPSPSGQ
ncbi:MAG: hypothetical protein BJ554DRAFT_1256 [Olpidium bornovanus]|uniref:Uncharacterized protein n=1 Tax=Olpidium bornovanus TaxID=278681 RepID=A0A8H7ZSD7_9FUNG|nr:MAG: hypothetical protein BJ554DRAFT_1256 [Olpidium bornovanus]